MARYMNHNLFIRVNDEVYMMLRALQQLHGSEQSGEIRALIRRGYKADIVNGLDLPKLTELEQELPLN